MVQSRSAMATARSERFTWNGVGYHRPARTFSTLEKIGGYFRLTLEDQSVYDFDLLAD